MTDTVRNYKDLHVWRRGMDLVESTYRLTDDLPAREQFGLIAQMRRAALSVPSNIAEGYARLATGDYRRHVSIARGSLAELETQLLVCQRLGYLLAEDVLSQLAETETLGKMLAALVRRLR